MSTLKHDRMRGTAVSTLTALACLLVSGTALAASAAIQVASVTVSYGDLDLSKPAGAQTLYRRIKAAARTVCGPSESRDLRRWTFQRACYDQAVADAVADVDRNTLTTLYCAGSSRNAALEPCAMRNLAPAARKSASGR